MIAEGMYSRAFNWLVGKIIERIGKIEGVPAKLSEKLKNFFYDPEKKKALHGIPSVTAKQREEYNKKKSKWKIHFAQERDFLSDCVVALNFSEHNKLPGDPGTSTMVDDSDDLEPQAETPAGVDKLPWEE